MDNVQEQKLLSYLSDAGFNGDEFQKQLRKKIRLNTPNFSLEHAIAFGEHQMLWGLQFAKDLQFNAYRLEGYNATLRTSPQIEHAAVNGINTFLLEERFKSVNWDLYFNDPKALMPDNERQEIRTLLSDLWQLTAKPSQEGKLVQDLLQYKYWPEHAWDDSTRDIQRIYDRSRSFQATEYGICNTSLAFNILSGRLDDIYEKLQVLELDQYPVYEQLEKQLSGTPSAFQLRLSRNNADGFTEYNVPVMLVDGFYHIDTYTASLVLHPLVEHGVYNGIDTAQLEQLMQQIDWHDDNQLFIFHEDSEPEFRSKVGDVQEQLFRLSQDMAGADIADRLQLKYWADATFFSDMLQQGAWDLLETLPKRESAFGAETSVRAAYNMLCGRAVCPEAYVPEYIVNGSNPGWFRLDLNKRQENGKYPMITVPGFNIGGVVDMLPLAGGSERNTYRVTNSLMRGDLVTAELNNGKKILLEANPEQNTVNIFTPDHRPVYTNIHLDPDWNPQQMPAETEHKKQQRHQHIKAAKPIRRSKRRGL